ncbi:MAG: phosphatase PAP2 family protein [Thermoproteus sp. AZ2]|jgi:membrane-associated phospholipid phosphatase|uniref:Phosphatase PAP2 family protein n=1 Tax=Thermoproteus sp. AZ2 TaxID=1609232 RepID=A0ACC6UZ99_9CREN|nr:MAG: hypothetical protein TU35_05405 [Thermoproteus sp. AZ2]
MYRRHAYIAAALYAAFAVIAAAVLAAGEGWSAPALLAIYDRPPALSAVLVPISIDDYGRALFWIPAALALWLAGGRYRATADVMIASFAISVVVGEALKHAFYVPRPFLVLDISPLVHEAADSSFPSGHALIVGTGAVAAAELPWYVSIPLIAEALLVSWGRLYIGAHWPVDVIAGWILAAANVELARATALPSLVDKIMSAIFRPLRR